MERLFERHGKPEILLGQRQGLHRGPQHNCYVERFNGSIRDELLNGELLHSVTEARVVIDDWITAYNTSRPHRGLGMMTPAAFAPSTTSRQRAVRGADEGDYHHQPWTKINTCG